jgi:glutamate synthase (ferredoxin)
MSGGIAYVLDENGDFAGLCNQDMVLLASLKDDEEIDIVKNMIWRHAYNTGSRRAWTILNNWVDFVSRFVAVIPKDYKRMIQAIDQAEKNGLSGNDAVLSAFEANKRDASRVAGL